jgi:hypothetical protein
VPLVKPCVFIQTNPKQYLGAVIAAHALKRNSNHSDSFDVRILNTVDFPFLAAREGGEYLRDGVRRRWRNDDLQSFTPLRFMPPEAMDYEGRAMIIDPDIFAIADIWSLLSRDMEGRAILCRLRSGPKGWVGHFASSAMLLDCTKLRHWQVERDFNEMFEGKRDYMEWISLKLENPDTIGRFEKEWNDFDRLTPETKMLHNTRRLTQPWKTGLPIDFTPADSFSAFPPYAWLMKMKKQVFGQNALFRHYRRHPDPNQERLFFGLLKECLESGQVSDEQLRDEMRLNHIRHDAFEVMERTERLAA